MEAKRLMLNNPFIKFETTLYKTVTTTWMTTIKNRHVILLCHTVDSIEERHEVLFGVDIFLTMSREQNIFSFLQTQTPMYIAGFNFGKVIVARNWT